MTKALRRLDDQDPWASPKRRRRIPSAALLFAAVAVVVGLLLWSHYTAGSGIRATTVSQNPTHLPNTPTTTHLRSTGRLLPAPKATAASSSYTFMHRDLGRPITWEPCRPIHYVVRTSNEPKSFDGLLQQAVAEVSRDTGLKFVYDGPTSEVVMSDPSKRAIFQPRKYGDRWAPVLITWGSSEEQPELAGAEGFAGPDVWDPGDGKPRYVSGLVSLDASGLMTLATEPHGAALVRDVLLHELGHLVGLDHVKDRAQLMFPRVQRGLFDYGPGDLAGLARLGNGPCYTDY